MGDDLCWEVVGRVSLAAGPPAILKHDRRQRQARQTQGCTGERLKKQYPIRRYKDVSGRVPKTATS